MSKTQAIEVPEFKPGWFDQPLIIKKRRHAMWIVGVLAVASFGTMSLASMKLLVATQPIVHAYQLEHKAELDNAKLTASHDTTTTTAGQQGK